MKQVYKMYEVYDGITGTVVYENKSKDAAYKYASEYSLKKECRVTILETIRKVEYMDWTRCTA